MMKVVYSEMDTPAGISCRLEAAGHAGYAPAGQDIVCAGASTVMQGLVCLLAGEKSARSDAFDEPDGPRHTDCGIVCGGAGRRALRRMGAGCL